MLRDIRTDYLKFELDEANLDPNPIQQLKKWLQEAIDKGVNEPTAMVLSTVDKDNHPDSRVVLLKDISPEGLIFFTNNKSSKGIQLSNNPLVAVNFFWPAMERQIRILGDSTKIPDEDAEQYFQSRPRESQIGAWASDQSEPIASRQEIEDRFKKFQIKYKSLDKIPKPVHWGGYLIKPIQFEFWQGRPNRLNDRIQYYKKKKGWKTQRLAP